MDTPNQADSTGNAVEETHQPEGAGAPIGWRQSKWLALVELALVALIFVADAYHHIYVSKTLYLLVLGWVSLRVRKLSWRDVGFVRNRSWSMTLALGVAGGIILEIIELFVTQPFLTRLTGKPPDLADFRILTGNIKYTLVALVLAWTLAAFGLAHAYQGVTGIIQEGFSGLLLGLIYLRTGKNLSVPIIAHGVSDTLDILLIFLGKFPGL